MGKGRLGPAWVPQYPPGGRTKWRALKPPDGGPDRPLASLIGVGTHSGPLSRDRRSVPRLALNRRESAEALGLGVDAFDDFVRPYVRCVYVGSTRRWPIAELERWLREEAESRSGVIGSTRSGGYGPESVGSARPLNHQAGSMS